MDFMSSFGYEMPPRPVRRRDRLDETYIFQLRIDLDGARPPIWRRIEIRSDVSLLTLHRVIQGAFEWYDYHLYRFSLGHPFSWDSEYFLCDYDMTDGEDEGTFVDDVRLDETLQEPGDKLNYVYDYGDSWHHSIKLEKVRQAMPDDPIAVCIAGRRAAPPEDSRGMTEQELLDEFDFDPAYFDLDEINEAIDSWLVAPAGFAPAGPVPELFGFDQETRTLIAQFPQFKSILNQCQDQQARSEMIHRLEILASDDPRSGRPVPEEPELVDSLSAVQLLLDEIGTGVRLTSAGYLPPKIAFRFGEELGLRDFELSTGGESKMLAVMHVREALQQVGLLRKYKGDLLLTKAAKDGRETTSLLWNHLAARLLPSEPSARTFSHDAALLSLLFAATSDDGFELQTVAELLTDSGWRVNHEPVERHDVVFQGSWQTILLWYIAPNAQRAWFSNIVSPSAAELARAALLTMKPQ